MTTVPTAGTQPQAESRQADSSRDVRARPTNKRGVYVEHDEFVKMVTRMIRAAGKRVQISDPETLALVAKLAQVLADIELDSARELNEQGFSWEAIAASQSIAMQTAYQKYALGQRAGRSRKGAPTTLPREVRAALGIRVKSRKARHGGERIFTVTDPGDYDALQAAEKLAAWLAEQGWTVTSVTPGEVRAEDRP